MRRRGLIVSIIGAFAISIAIAVLAPSQVIVGNYNVTYVTVAPSGACAQGAPMQLVVTTGVLYSCQSGTWGVIGGGSSTVSSITGDGTLITNSGSTGAVTLTLGTAAANTVWAGPTSGAAATPTYRALVAADIPTAAVGAVPAWLTYLGDGSDGSNTNASGFIVGDKYYTNFTVPFGNTVQTQTVGLTIHATGTCTIAGTILGNGANNNQSASGVSGEGYWGGTSGGAGGGASAGAAGNVSVSIYAANAGTTILNLQAAAAGSSSGGNGANGSTSSNCGASGLCSLADYQRAGFNGGGGQDSLWFNGAKGVQGGSSGGAGGNGGSHVTLICAQITGTDGTHTGTIDVSGAFGTPPSANSTGAGSGGGGGVIMLSSQGAVSTYPNLSVTGGPGGLVTVPEAVGTGGTCTSPAKATLGVSAGALSGTCTVVQAGAGCGTGTGVTFNVVGGGGTLGTGAVNPTWSGGTLASCTATPGTSSGYTAATFTTAGTGGDGMNGWSKEYSGW